MQVKEYRNAIPHHTIFIVYCHGNQEASPRPKQALCSTLAPTYIYSSDDSGAGPALKEGLYWGGGGLILRDGLILRVGLHSRVGLYSGWAYTQGGRIYSGVGSYLGGLILRVGLYSGWVHTQGWAHTQGGFILKGGLILRDGLIHKTAEEV